MPSSSSSCFSLFCTNLLTARNGGGGGDEPFKAGLLVAYNKNDYVEQHQSSSTAPLSSQSLEPPVMNVPHCNNNKNRNNNNWPYTYEDARAEAEAAAARAEEERRFNQKIPWVWSRTFHETYQLGDALGQGAHAVVHDATRIDGGHGQGQHYAIKIIERRQLTRNHLLAFKNEVQVLANLRHPNIIRLVELYKDPQYFFVVLEKLNGGELFDRLCQKRTYSEADARDLCRTIFTAVAYCHDHHIAHRDLKPENLLLAHAHVQLPQLLNSSSTMSSGASSPCNSRTGNENDNPNRRHHHRRNDSNVSMNSTVSLPSNHDDTDVKIADFGFAKRVVPGTYLTTRCGSPAYTAPEIINYQPYNTAVDNWSLGVILFTILGGYPPFYGQTVHETFQQIRQGSICFLPERWDGISPDAKRLIRGLLAVDPNKRLTMKQALEHPWMTGRGELLRKKCLRKNLERLKQFNVERRKPENSRVLHQSGPVKSVSMYWLVSRR